MKFALCLALVLAVTSVHSQFAYGEATPLDSGSFVSPDHRFAFLLSPAKYGYHAKIEDLNSNKSTDSVLAVPETVKSGGGMVLNSANREYSQPIDFQTAIYRVTGSISRAILAAFSPIRLVCSTVSCKAVEARRVSSLNSATTP